MPRNLCLPLGAQPVLAVLLAAWSSAALCVDASGQATGPDTSTYEHALTLRERWMYLTDGVADPARWIDAQSFRYRRTVPGGFEFVMRSVDALDPQPAFDHEALARALSETTGHPVRADRLPFADYEEVRGETAAEESSSAAIVVEVDGERFRCTLGESSACAPDATDRPSPRPRAFGVVRDLTVAADNTPRRSPDGGLEAYVHEGRVAVRRLDDDAEPRLLGEALRDPGAEFYDPETLVWSPDSRRLAVYRVRPGDRREVVRVETSPRDQVHARVQTQLYPKPGDAVDIERPVLFDVETGQMTDVDTGSFPNPYRLGPMRFRSDSRTLAFRYTERGHQRVRLIEVDAANGDTRVVIDETSATFVNSWPGRDFAHDVGNHGREILWMSERSGWNHLYRIDGRTGRVQAITRGDWLVRRVVRVDEERREIWFTGGGREPGDPYFQHVYRVGFDGRGLRRMSEAEAWHDVALSPDLRHYVLTWSRVDHPPVSELRDARSGQLVAELERGDIRALLAAGFRMPEPFVASGRDGVTPIWGLIVRPTDYDPKRRYRVIENIYAGPHDSFVPKTFWPFGFHSGGDKVIGMQAMAEMGFIVVQIDGMGTMNRSKAFHEVAWKNLGDSGFPDRIAWHHALALHDPSYAIDDGVGIYGASAGGQSALGALLFHPEFYSVAVAYNGCYDNRMDKISWNEQWMGWPVDDSYARASGVAQAHRLQGRLLMIVGEQDENVDPASTYQVADALIRAGKDFDLLALPGEGHAVGRSTGPIEYVQRRQFDFFVRHLLRQPTPDWNRGR